MKLYDAHNHLQDDRLDGARAEILKQFWDQGVVRCVVNGTQEADWDKVRRLADEDGRIIASYGLHPWHVGGASPDWRGKLAGFVDGGGGVGEIGLDRWIEGYDLASQRDAFRWQLKLAADRDLPVSIHCLKAWGELHEILRTEDRPERGFLLHSYGGSEEMAKALAKLGGYFSISGYFAHERKRRQREVFKSLPRERILIETDAPDMAPPEEITVRELRDQGERLNHPANIGAVYHLVARELGMPVDELAELIGENFKRLFER